MFASYGRAVVLSLLAAVRARVQAVGLATSTSIATSPASPAALYTILETFRRLRYPAQSRVRREPSLRPYLVLDLIISVTRNCTARV